MASSPCSFGVILVSIVFTCLIGLSTGGCSWSNEHCSRDTDCCSHSCFRPFEGTNPRCRHSTLSERCIFTFHCGDDLECGPHFNCCSPYWKMCTKTSDCCDPLHVCKPADGFYYDRCLFPNSAPKLLGGILPRGVNSPFISTLPLVLQAALSGNVAVVVVLVAAVVNRCLTLVGLS